MNPNDPNLPLLEQLVVALGDLANSVVIVGGCAAGLLVTDPANPEVRETKDVDAVVAVTSLLDYQEFEGKLRKMGFRNDMGDSAPACRYLYGDIQFDVMPSDPNVGQDSNRWYPEAVSSATTIVLDSGVQFRLISAPVFLATKLEAFDDRGNDDFYGSQDMEDIIAVADGRKELPAELSNASDELQQFVRERVTTLIESSRFWDAVSGFYRREAESLERMPILRERMKTMAS